MHNPPHIWPIGTATVHGEVAAIFTRRGERTYMARDKGGVVTVIPADLMDVLVMDGERPVEGQEERQ